MYAVFEDGSRQYRVSEGDIVTVDYREVEPGARLEFNKVLLHQSGTDVQIGRPVLEGVRVLAEVLDLTSIKYYIRKYKKRKNYRRFKGHRQWFTKLRVSNILLPGQEAPAVQPKQPKQEQTPAAPAPSVN